MPIWHLTAMWQVVVCNLAIGYLVWLVTLVVVLAYLRVRHGR